VSTPANGQFWSIRAVEMDPAAARAGLGKRLRAVRQHRLNLTLAEFGKQVASLSGRNRSFSNVTVANWESGRQEPSFATLQAIARLSDLPLCYFASVGELEEFPRINWFATENHENDNRLRRLFGELQNLPSDERRLALGALEGLIEGLHKAEQQVDEVAG
jgi:transcriptional regulator with XRE-family HTH domain